MKRLIAQGWSALALAGVAIGAFAQGPAPAPIPNLAGKVLTVNGPIAPSALGKTLTHEHIFINFKKPPNMVPLPTDITVIQPPGQEAPKNDRGSSGLVDFNESLNAIMQFKNEGGGTIVDVSNFGLTRDPLALKLVSRASGLNVIMGAGWYMHNYHPDDMDKLTVQQLTDIIVQDVTVGAQGSDIRSGIIGEVGVGDFEGMRNPHPLAANVLKSVRASARASRITGAPLSIHNFETLPQMMDVLDIIKSEGVDLRHVIMSHTGGRPAEDMEALFKRGVYVEWDYMGQAPLKPEAAQRTIDSVAAMIKAGHVSQIVLSHDICTQRQLKAHDGGGYTYIDDVIVPGLKAKGVSDADIHEIMVANPARVLTFVAPQAPIKQPT